MSRSVRRTPIHGHSTSVSESTDKKIWHGRLRAAERTAMAVLAEGRDHIATIPNDIASAWDMAKGGKAYWSATNIRDMADYAARRGKTRAEKNALTARAKAKAWAK